MHAILQFGNKGYSLCKVDECDGEVPVFVDEWREVRHSRMVSYHGEGWTRFHPDASNRIIRFESDHLRCYTIQSASNGKGEGKGESPSRVILLWSVQLLPSIDRIRCGSPDFDRDLPHHTNIVHSIKLVPGNMLMITMIYNANMAQYDSVTPPYRFCPIAIFLDSRTGILVKVTPIHNAVFFAEGFGADGIGGLYTVGAADETDTKVVRIHRLVEKESLPNENIKFKSGALNRKQRRFKRRAESRPNEKEELK
ncbi:hypothetical protein PENTCL1PPCAC_6384 [Pristionchus entomophagus]|uniref:Uncharacterized protein n=1 Tax=Pristionchus entomophagus TaxID=358040 RepID=A0AAV5SS84_9BILA|nr:hypothetical protein PENTCL1PPCAC_6384 [Pristionchus entomophagus]